MVIVKNKVKEIVKKSKAPLLSSDFIPALDKKVAEVVKKAIGRAVFNGRKTVRGGDL